MKTLSRIGLSFAVAACAALGPSTPARADAAGDAVLAQMDAAMNKYKTLKLEYEIINKESPDKDERTLGLKVLVKGE